jgi:hypothetical protein
MKAMLSQLHAMTCPKTVIVEFLGPGVSGARRCTLRDGWKLGLADPAFASTLWCTGTESGVDHCQEGRLDQLHDQREPR